MSPKIVFAALFFCCVLVGFGYTGIVTRPTPSDSYDSNYYNSYPSNNYYVDQPTIQWPSLDIQQILGQYIPTHNKRQPCFER